MSLEERAPIANTIEEAVVGWLNNDENLVRAKNLDGGWEGWAQIQLAFYLQQATNAKVSRECKIYAADPDKRADLFVAPTQGTNIGLELKCRTKGETIVEFQQRFLKDIDKISSGIKTTCLMYAMAVTDCPGDTIGWDKFADIVRPQHCLKATGWMVIIWFKAFK